VANVAVDDNDVRERTEVLCETDTGGADLADIELVHLEQGSNTWNL
jgi:hypothetical protein